jgi:hypothetical protein
MNILQHSNDIIYNRTEEKDRKYGPMATNMEDASRIASILRNKTIDPEDVLACLIGLKFSRERFNHKYDNILDAIGYLASYNDMVSCGISDPWMSSRTIS